MTRQFVSAALAMTLCLTVSLAYGQSRGRGGERQRGGKPPGGEWSERTHGGQQSKPQAGNERGESKTAGPASEHASGRNATPEASGAQGAAAANRNAPKASGAQGAAAANRNAPNASGAQGAAAANRNAPNASGAQGAAAANRNAPTASGAQGAAAGAAAANRNAPQASGKQGAAAGAAAANRNAPQVSGAQGAAAGAAAANRNAPQVSGASGAAAGYAAVRNSVDHPNIYGQQWYGDHPDAWAASGWAAGAAWVPSTWGAVAAHCGYGSAKPISYDYGVNVTSQNGNVIVDGQSVGTVAEFSQQAADLAQIGTEVDVSATEPWLPLGVFAMVRNENQHPQLIVQLAVNRQGILRGNYTDELTDHTLPIHGAVDKQTQRAAWLVGGNTQTVMEAGLKDLTQSEVSALIHKNGKTDHWLLVRLAQPKQPNNDGDGSGAEK